MHGYDRALMRTHGVTAEQMCLHPFLANMSRPTVMMFKVRGCTGTRRLRITRPCSLRMGHERERV